MNVRSNTTGGLAPAPADPSPKPWYSARGARRGLSLAALAAALWLAWAAGYLQGSQRPPAACDCAQ